MMETQLDGKILLFKLSPNIRGCLFQKSKLQLPENPKYLCSGGKIVTGGEYENEQSKNNNHNKSFSLPKGGGYGVGRGWGYRVGVGRGYRVGWGGSISVKISLLNHEDNIYL